MSINNPASKFEKHLVSFSNELNKNKTHKFFLWGEGLFIFRYDRS